MSWRTGEVMWRPPVSNSLSYLTGYRHGQGGRYYPAPAESSPATPCGGWRGRIGHMIASHIICSVSVSVSVRVRVRTVLYSRLFCPPLLLAIWSVIYRITVPVPLCPSIYFISTPPNYSHTTSMLTGGNQCVNIAQAHWQYRIRVGRFTGQGNKYTVHVHMHNKLL